MLWSCLDELEGDQFEATLFESTDDLADKRALHAVGLQFMLFRLTYVDIFSSRRLNYLNHDVGAFGYRHC